MDVIGLINTLLLCLVDFVTMWEQQHLTCYIVSNFHLIVYIRHYLRTYFNYNNTKNISDYYGFMDNNYRFIMYLLNDRKTC